MRVYQRGGWFWIAFTDARGRSVRRSLKTRDYSEAQRKMYEMGLGVANGSSILGDDAEVSTLIDRYLSRGLGLRPASRDRLERCLANVARVLGESRITDPDFRARVKAYREKRTAQGAAPRTVNKEVGMLKQVIADAIESSPGAVNPLAGLKQLRVPRKETRGLTLGEMRRVFAVLRTPDERLRFGLYAFTGMRRGEGTHLRWCSVDMRRRVIHVEPYEEWQPKTGEPRAVPVCRELFDILREAPRRSIYVLTTMTGRPFHADHGGTLLRWFKKTYRRAALERPEELGVHSIRHGYISRLAQMGVRAELRAKLAGHRSLSMHRDVYTHADLQDALEAGRALSYA